MYALKAYGLPAMYWNGMLRGRMQTGKIRSQQRQVATRHLACQVHFVAKSRKTSISINTRAMKGHSWSK